jgi:hypothetical protein
MANIANGAANCLANNYNSGTGTAGADNTAQTVKTIVLPANRISEYVERIHIQGFWQGTTGSNVTATLALNGVTLATTTDSGAATTQVVEAWVYYVGSTHGNIISYTAGALNTTLSAYNVAGFDWTVDQNITIAQDAALNNHIIVFSLAGTVYPKGNF